MRIIAILLYLFLLTSCIEYRHYTRDVHRMLDDRITEDSFDKKWYKLYAEKSDDSKLIHSILNKTFTRNRINFISNAIEYGGISFKFVDSSKFVFIKPGYQATHESLVSYIKNSKRFSGYALAKNGYLYTEHIIVGELWEVKHVIDKYKFENNTLMRVETYAFGQQYNSRKDTITYQMVK